MAVAFAWQEYRRANKRHLLLRIIAVVLAVTALACIILPIAYDGALNKTAERKAILLTTGFNNDSLNRADTNIITADAVIKNQYPNAKLINGLNELPKNTNLHIYGYGLNEDELAQLDTLPIVFHPAKAPVGVNYVNWDGSIKAGEPLHVQGQYNNTSAQKVKLVLNGLNTGLDSVMLPPNAQTNFNLSTIPKTTGKIVFTLYADTALQGSIPVQIAPVKPLRILMLSASPDFESKFLKNWLTGNGYAVALRSAISKNKFNSEFINTDQFNLSKLSAQTLNKFDVVFGDLSVFNGLSVAENSALKQAVADNGLGLIVRADSTGKTSWLQQPFPVDRASGKEPAAGPILINGKKSAGKLNNGLAYIAYQNGTQPLIKNTQQQVLASSALYGSGKIIFTTLNNTFTWILGGNKQDYWLLWSTLITKAARKENPDESQIEVLTPAYAGEPVHLQIAQGNASPLIINGKNTPSLQNAAIPFEYRAQYRPAKPGWQTLQSNNWYAYTKQSWAVMQASAKLSATKKYAKAHQINSIVTKQIQQKMRIDVPKIYFYILLLAACTFLWAEIKSLF
ncbi:hypothetical protein [Mucilaginibacter phyllosphaerae]|uniref:Uncharacterized protein n=1 Tax=Mucilaginibacter phyllosphaerae TaxID=1812349 RepID=A0A4Y8AFF9_9SPHI|nr:hypothetical protein [Mucilaginibacter phyllosphaerae]MBB3968863.1 hypothetical protein [Mucilaginibacter phyllosphaerae]TEW67508.1 hypothetical protein E2R65_05835 [Mucilaginibacter phyllosphaerae]